MRILLVGLPRSGTTWCAEALARAPGVTYDHEPDNRTAAPYAAIATRGLGANPSLSPGDRAPAYERLWDIAFGGGWPAGALARAATRISHSPRRVPRTMRILAQTPIAIAASKRASRSTHRLVKSVHATGSVEWIADRFSPAIVVMWRNPLRVFASYKRLGWADPNARDFTGRHPLFDAEGGDPSVAAAAVMERICRRTEELLKTSSRHEDWTLIRHEDLIDEGEEGFRRLVKEIGLEWSPEIAAFLAGSDRPGEAFSTNRDRARLGTSWAAGLSPDEIASATTVMERFVRRDVVGSRFAACISGH